MQPTHYIIHYAEIGLKGKNRRFFEDQLMANLKKALPKKGVKSVKRIAGRILLEIAPSAELDEINGSLKKVFGVSHFSPAVAIKADFDEIKSAALDIFKSAAKEINSRETVSFKVSTKRSNKLFPMTSMQVSQEVGAFILQKNKNAKVRMKDPDCLIQIEIVDKLAFVFLQKITACGGLPVGVSGRVVSLLSGGIDSPLASWRLMKRGCEVILVHFHSRPQTDRASVEKVVNLAEKLAEWQPDTKLYLIPFLDIQKQIVQNTRSDYRVILYRRFMYRLAAEVAGAEKAKALVTGEAVGQVASQTLNNIAAIADAIELPVLRPLIGMDKEEIINQAKMIDTYELSIVPHHDCCSLFVPRHPVTKASLEVARAEEAKLDVTALIAKAMLRKEVREIKK